MRACLLGKSLQQEMTFAPLFTGTRSCAVATLGQHKQSLCRGVVCRLMRAHVHRLESIDSNVCDVVGGPSAVFTVLPFDLWLTDCTLRHGTTVVVLCCLLYDANGPNGHCIEPQTNTKTRQSYARVVPRVTVPTAVPPRASSSVGKHVPNGPI